MAVRKIPKNYLFVTGGYASRKNESMDGFESLLEKEYLLLLDFDRLPTAPSYSLLDNIVYCCNGRDVNTVFVNGRMVVQEGQLLTANEKDLALQIEEHGRSLMSRAVRGDAELETLFRSNPRYSLG